MSQDDTNNQLTLIVNSLNSREMQQEIKAFLPANVDLRKFMQTAITAVQRAGHVIARCDRQSVYNAIADAASKGLMPDGRQGALVPYRERVKTGSGPDDYKWVNKCQFLIMPEGIIEVAARNGATLYAVSVYEGDSVRLWNDAEGQHFEHDFNPFGERGAMIGAVAVGRARNGSVYVEAVNAADIAKIKAASKQKDANGNMRGPWAEWEDRMWQKSAMHRLHKRMPGIPVEEDAEYTGERNLVRIAPDPPAQTAPALTHSPAETQPLPAASREPAQQPAPPRGRPRGLQRMVDQRTGEVYEMDGSASTPDAPPPTAQPKAKDRPPKEDPF